MVVFVRFSVFAGVNDWWDRVHLSDDYALNLNY